MKTGNSDIELTTRLLNRLREEKQMQLRGGIYHRTQVDMTYNSNHIEGSKLTHEQTRLIFETNTIGLSEQAVRVDDIMETVNHFRCFDYIIDVAEQSVSAEMIKHIHLLLKSGTTDSRRDWFAVGDYKRIPNEVGGLETTAPEDVAEEMEALLDDYNQLNGATLYDVLNLHVAFERIHPFQDGNGRVGRLLLFKECLRHGLVPFVITDDMKMFYYRGLREWGHIDEYLTDTCLSAQDSYRPLLEYFRI